MSTTVYDVITSRIIQALDQGVVPWRQSWVMSAPKNLVSKKAYRGINVFLLNAGRFTSPYFLTYKQAQGLGGNVKRGEKSTPVVFWRLADSKEVGKDGTAKKFPILRYYSLFSVSQCEGIDMPLEEGRTSPFTPIEACQRIVDGYVNKGPKVVHGGDRACYSPTLDEVSMPGQDTFETPEAYYATMFHELSHSSGHKDRLNREGITNIDSFGSHQYSFEELVAEMGGAFLCGEAGILDQTIDQSASYINNWVSRLQRNPKWVIQAGGAASKAAEFILGRNKASEDEAGE